MGLRNARYFWSFIMHKSPLGDLSMNTVAHETQYSPGSPEPHPTKDLLKSCRAHAPWNTSLPKTEFEYSKYFPLSMCCFIRLYLYTKHLKRMQSKLSYLVDQQFPLVQIEEAMKDFIIQVDNRVCSERSLASGRSLWEDSGEELEC